MNTLAPSSTTGNTYDHFISLRLVCRLYSFPTFLTPSNRYSWLFDKRKKERIVADCPLVFLHVQKNNIDSLLLSIANLTPTNIFFIEFVVGECGRSIGATIS